MATSNEQKNRLRGGFEKPIAKLTLAGTLALGAFGIGACGTSASAEKGPETPVPAATANVTPGAHENTPSSSSPTVAEAAESRPWSPADLEVKKPAFALSPELQKLWDGSLNEFLAATDTQRLTVGHAMITPEQLEVNMKHDPYSKELVPFLAPPTIKDDGSKINTYDLVKNLQAGDGRVFHKASGGLDSEMALKYIAANTHDPAHSPSFQAMIPQIEALDGKIGADITEKIEISSENAPSQKVIDGQSTQVREFQATSSRVGNIVLKYAYIEDQDGTGDYILVDH